MLLRNQSAAGPGMSARAGCMLWVIIMQPDYPQAIDAKMMAGGPYIPTFCLRPLSMDWCLLFILLYLNIATLSG